MTPPPQRIPRDQGPPPLRGRLNHVTRALIALIHFYQRWISPLLGPSCRFEPSCSRYAVGVLEARGIWRGSLLSLARLCKCHPFHPGGWDPPPTNNPLQNPPTPQKVM